MKWVVFARRGGLNCAGSAEDLVAPLQHVGRKKPERGSRGEKHSSLLKHVRAARKVILGNINNPLIYHVYYVFVLKVPLPPPPQHATHDVWCWVPVVVREPALEPCTRWEQQLGGWLEPGLALSTTNRKAALAGFLSSTSSTTGSGGAVTNLCPNSHWETLPKPRHCEMTYLTCPSICYYRVLTLTWLEDKSTEFPTIKCDFNMVQCRHKSCIFIVHFMTSWQCLQSKNCKVFLHFFAAHVFFPIKIPFYIYSE